MMSLVIREGGGICGCTSQETCRKKNNDLEDHEELVGKERNMAKKLANKNNK